MYSAGIDIGSRSIECVIFDGTGITGAKAADTGSHPTKNADTLFLETISECKTDLSRIAQVTTTGYGRNYYPKADKSSSEILCHAAGVFFYHPGARTVIDIGGQDSKIIQLDINGKVANFSMNDRCAAGTGKFIEMAALTLGVGLREFGPQAVKADSATEISSMCAVFAESEIIGLLHKGCSVESILKGVSLSVARRILGMTGKTALEGELVLTGGVALNVGIVSALEEVFGKKVTVAKTPQFTGALGAALLGWKRME